MTAPKYPKPSKCGAKAKSTGQPCQNPAMANGRCRYHGGLTPKGPALPQFKTGKYSRYVPKGMLADYTAALNDADLLELVEQIGLVDARVSDLLRKLGTTESGGAWRRLGDLWGQFEAAMDAKEVERVLLLRAQIRDTVRRGLGETAQWDELGRQLDRVARLKREERDRRVAARQLIQSEAVMAALILMVETAAQAVRRYADIETGRNILKDISESYERIMAGREGV